MSSSINARNVYFPTTPLNAIHSFSHFKSELNYWSAYWQYHLMRWPVLITKLSSTYITNSHTRKIDQCFLTLSLNCEIFKGGTLFSKSITEAMVILMFSLIDSMEKRHSWGPDSHSTSQFPTFYRTQRLMAVHNSLPPVPILTHINLILTAMRASNSTPTPSHKMLHMASDWMSILLWKMRWWYNSTYSISIT